jgi:hypothetical protein
MTEEPSTKSSRLALASALPSVIMLLVGFAVAFLIGVKVIGLWATVILWAALLSVFAVGLVLVVRLAKKR